MAENILEDIKNLKENEQKRDTQIAEHDKRMVSLEKRMASVETVTTMTSHDVKDLKKEIEEIVPKIEKIMTSYAIQRYAKSSRYKNLTILVAVLGMVFALLGINFMPQSWINDLHSMGLKSL